MAKPRPTARSPAPAPKTGRPTKAKEDRKDDIIRVRVTAEQKAAFTAAAERAGYDVSTWLRGLGVRESQRSEVPEVIPPPERRP